MIGTNWVLHYSDQELKMFNWLLINPTLSGSRTFGSFDNEINNWWRDAWVKLIVPLQCNVPSDLSSSSNPSSEDTFQWNLSTPVPIILFLSLSHKFCTPLCDVFCRSFGQFAEIPKVRHSFHGRSHNNAVVPDFPTPI